MRFLASASTPRVLIIDGDKGFTGEIESRLYGYFDKRSLSINTDCVPSIERALLHLKYYDYDIALVSCQPANDESGLDLPELLRIRKISLPVIIAAKPGDGNEREEAIRAGAAGFFIIGKISYTHLMEAVDTNILKFRASLEKKRLNDDLRRKNKELKKVNDTLTNQSVKFLKLKEVQEHQRKKMESLLNSLIDGVFYCSSSGEIEMQNPAARRIFRFDEKDAAISRDDLAVFVGCDPLDITAEADLPATIFARDYMINAIDVEYGSLAGGRMLVIRDVTRDREVERLKAEFQSIISHELRTPLTAISGAVDNFMSGNLGRVSKRQREFLSMMRRNVNRQMSLINDMLDLAKLEADKMFVDVSRIDPESAAMVSYENFRYAFEEKGVKLSLETDAGLPKIDADGRMLTQILDNLLANAVKFTKKGGSVKIKISADSGNNLTEGAASIVYRVADNGIGVPDDRKEKIFDRYYQVDSGATRAYKGTGLGLAICRKMAQMHNGAVVCTDAEGGGAVFSLTLPVAAASRKKIMLITGDSEHRKMDEEVLGREFRLIVLDSGEGAHKEIVKSLPQLVLLDYHIPVVDGLEIYSGMKKDPATKRVPVIFLGGHMEERDKIKALKMGASDFVERPYSVGEFLARVKRLLVNSAL
ncbi:MAG: hypothetical protein IEMM0002_0281 [bacterium]|nr:MAG: hypothetical protein IEMM0002_0281 [bacterium]